MWILIGKIKILPRQHVRCSLLGLANDTQTTSGVEAPRPSALLNIETAASSIYDFTRKSSATNRQRAVRSFHRLTRILANICNHLGGLTPNYVSAPRWTLFVPKMPVSQAINYIAQIAGITAKDDSGWSQASKQPIKWHTTTYLKFLGILQWGLQIGHFGG